MAIAPLRSERGFDNAVRVREIAVLDFLGRCRDTFPLGVSEHPGRPYAGVEAGQGQR